MKKIECGVPSNTTRSIIKYLLMMKLAILLIFAISTQTLCP